MVYMSWSLQKKETPLSMMGIFNYWMYDHKATVQTTEQGNENVAEKEV